MQDYWDYHNAKMIELKQIYNRIDKQKQNKLQEIFDTYNFTFDHLYNIADIKTKNRINTYIEELKDKELLNGYFGMLANNIYKRSRVKNSEILELLIYGAYIEEQSKLDKYEKQIMREDMDYYYQNGQNEVLNAKKSIKKASVIPDAIFLALLDMQSANGFNLQQNIQATIQYNVQQLYKQTLINIQQQKELEIKNNEFQRIINQQQNSKLCVNGDKISGMIDNQLIGLNNMAKAEGIKEQDNDAKVRFIAVIDGKETDMCHSLDNQVFYIDKENIFDRYYGETSKELRIQRIKCKGLVLGLNLPPISHHFHWCRSTITYLVPVEKETKTEYNGLASSISNTLKRHQKPKILEKINYKNEKEVRACLEKYEKVIQDSNIENAIVIAKNGSVYQCYGNKDSVWPDYDLGNKLKEAYVTHNHPKKETEYSFSESDIALFNNYKLKILRGKDHKYTYELNRNKDDIEEIDIFNMSDDDGIHALNISRAKKYKIGYRRWKND